jgi:hypothetical protein
LLCFFSTVRLIQSVPPPYIYNYFHSERPVAATAILEARSPTIFIGYDLADNAAKHATTLPPDNSLRWIPIGTRPTIRARLLTDWITSTKSRLTVSIASPWNQGQSLTSLECKLAASSKCDWVNPIFLLILTGYVLTHNSVHAAMRN